MKKMLTAIVAAAGLVGCAKGAAVYDQSFLFNDGGQQAMARVYSDNEMLEMSVSGMASEEIVGLRIYENAGSTECLREELFASNSEGDALYTDEECEGTVDSIESQGVTIPRSYFGSRNDSVLAYGRTALDSVFDIERQIAEWHARKGLQKDL